MTDKEIAKALVKWCDNNCKKVCPHLKICDKCVVTYIKSVLNLINRQKAEIEKLDKEQNTFAKRFYKDGIKDFAERLKASQIITHRSKEGVCVYEFDDELIDTRVEEMTVNYESSKNDKPKIVLKAVERDIDDIVEEMTEDGNEQTHSI
jgi:hypothetical protein